MRLLKRFYIIPFFLIITAFCDNYNSSLSKEDYKIITKTLNFYVDSLELCQERKTIIVSDSTSLKLSSGGIDAKEILKYLKDTSSVVEFLTFETKNKLNRIQVDKKVKIKGCKVFLKRNTTMFEIKKDEFYWQNIMKYTPDFCRYISFSKPLIKGNLAAIYVEGITTYNYGSGYRFLLVKEEKEWKVVHKKKVWVS